MSAKKKKLKILLVAPSFSTFIMKDLALLKKHFNVKMQHYPSFKSTIKILPKIINGVMWSDLTFSWFADIHAFSAVFLSRIFGKKSIVVVGGYEVARIPEIDYGLALSALSSRIVKFVLNKADAVLTVDDSLKKDAFNNLGVTGEHIQTVPTGYDPEIWRFKGKKENLVMCVANINKENLKRKGLETFVQAAEYLPEIEFLLVGPYKDEYINYLKTLAPKNINFPGRIPNEELPLWYSRAKVYCQLSRYEGLPNSLCEAMLCECVPVGTKHCGIPVAIGDTGFYVPYGDVEATVEAIQKAMTSDRGKEARERIKNLFPLKKREKTLVDIIDDLVKSRK